MNTTLRDALAEQINEVGPAHLDVDELVGLGEQRLRRRRRLTAALGSATAVVLVIALAIGGAALNRSADPGPTDTPNTDHKKTDDDIAPPNVAQARKIVYSEGFGTHTVHFGDRVVETGDGHVHLDVTDDGFIYTKDGRAWFSDGGPPEQIGSHLCGASPSGEFSHYANRAVMTANTGSLAAWFDCTQATRPTLVLYDTASRREVAHRQLAPCGAGYDSCELYDLTSGQVYLNQGVYAGYPRPEYRFDVTTGHLSATNSQSYAEDVRSHPRGLVVGDRWQTGTAAAGTYNGFRVVGSRLVTNAFDTATGHAVRLRLPPGYHAEPGEFTLFEWLDDDTVALVGLYEGNREANKFDILTCQLSDGRCDLTVQGPEGGGGGVVVGPVLPGRPLPG
ncbi:MAG: hypothetical protein H0V07_11605 [Propionibacteriales bacterium]|nr:hypothetical protein [Propionibacteriales bacterium]